jgi:hypothetical protein
LHQNNDQQDTNLQRIWERQPFKRKPNPTKTFWGIRHSIEKILVLLGSFKRMHSRLTSAPGQKCLSYALPKTTTMVARYVSQNCVKRQSNAIMSRLQKQNVLGQDAAL